MFQYILALLLINTYYQSAAAPGGSLNAIPNRSLISNSLTLLASGCGNKFLSEQIISKIQECKLLGDPPYNEKQFQCLMFYDINTQLCSAVNMSKLAITEDLSVKLIEKLNINTYCSLTSDWVFPNLPEYPLYNSYTDNLKLPASCGEICGYSDLANKDTNFYCKYYKWGFDMLKNHKTTTSNIVSSDSPSSQEESADIAVSPGMSTALPKQKLFIPNMQQDGLKVPITGTISKTNVEDHVQANIPTELGSMSVVQENLTAGQGNLPIGQGNLPTGQGNLPVGQGNLPIGQGNLPLGHGNGPVGQGNDDAVYKSSDVVLGNTGSAPANSGTVQGNGGVMQGIPVAQGQTTNSKLQTVSSSNYEVAGNPEVVDPSLPPLIKSSTKKTETIDGISNKNGVGSLGNIEDNAESPDKALDGLDEETEDEDENLESETFDSAEQKNTNLLEKTNMDIPKNEFARIDADEFTDDGDNFFPFFLTAVILVIMLYILYHNKNKVSKMFFGLILEGANGRRRSTRGHSYRRLDTLEQAMSANTGAPPSKIIY